MASKGENSGVHRAVVEVRGMRMDRTQRGKVVCSISGNMWVLWRKQSKREG